MILLNTLLGCFCIICGVVDFSKGIEVFENKASGLLYLILGNIFFLLSKIDHILYAEENEEEEQ